MRVWLVACVALLGCSERTIGPDAATQDLALRVTWENAYSMERETRPRNVTWWAADGCGEDLDVTGQTLAGACALDTESSSGDVYVRWQGSFTASSWSRALVMWRQYLMTGTMTHPNSDDLVLIAKSQTALSGL